ncbi:hypothetical protein [Mycobacterium sp. DBP42]|uniref:hypothetical protein n=1 Tax=Mycobacterium sp. DBP42 TaxID=2545267 RepID=UPI00110D22E3|nr:hypothetical protein [Mycobacterium sp. DBP42]TMS47644.1 hypothetical protein E0T84_28425 [Mycobacterium sp. DBP42]
MTGARDSAAPLRSTAVGSLTAALAVAAHGLAGGGLPGGAVAAQLVILAVTLGAVASAATCANRTAVVWGLLGTGQLLAHALLTTAGHSHSADPGLAMLVAHLLAVSLGAGLITCGARLCSAVSRAVRAVARAVRGLPVATVHASARSADQPRHSARFLAASVSDRGPPVGVRA